MDDLGLDAAAEEEPAEDDEIAAIQEILDMLSEDTEEEVLEEELIVDMGQVKDGTFQTDAGKLKYYQEMELAKTESTQYKEENEALEKKLKI
jgi:hypothetical protein